MMSSELSAPLSYMGILSVIISFGTVISSLFADRFTRRLGTGLVTAISVSMTAIGLLGFYLSCSFALLCVFAVPYGLGAGAVDAALNNYVALHYSSRHMSWLHCFWGVGASVGPYIMGAAIGLGMGWRGGFGIISVLQIALSAALFISLPLWKLYKSDGAEPEKVNQGSVGVIGALRLRGVKAILLAFFCYCSLEATAGLWASSYLVEHKGVSAETAAMLASMFYLGITFGRFICGFVADRVGDKRMVRLGCFVIILGISLIAIPVKSSYPAIVGLIIIGLGAAPIYPSLIHATPDNFGKENSQAIIGIQMASAYVGILIAPAVFGGIAETNISFYPFFMLLFALALLGFTERVNRVSKKTLR
jgi:MFS family permease